MKSFTPDFLLGASTAAHQVEGNNRNSDCWVMENIPHTLYAEPSGDAVDHYHRYEEDIRLLAQAGLNAYRFSVEWARIEPKEGQFNEKEIEHYRNVIHCCKENGVEPMLTLHHFSSPAWIISKGGWEAESIVEDFTRYCSYVAERLGSEITFVCTINEANIRLQIADIIKRYIQQARQASAAKDGENSLQMGINLSGLQKQQELNALEGAQAFGLSDPRSLQMFQSACTEEGDRIICRAHASARNAIKRICPHLQVGLTLSFHDFQAQAGAEDIAEREWDKEFRHYLPYIKEDDFLGVQNYTRSLIGPNGLLPVPVDAETTLAGYEYYPEGLAHVIRRAAEDFKNPIYVTENGIATADDNRRRAFIETALEGVQGCIDDGIPVRGYFHWSLLDNFEWQKGYAMTFGLIAVDRQGGQKRTPKPSLAYLGSCRDAHGADSTRDIH